MYCRRCHSIRSPLSILVSSVVNLNYFNVVSYFYSENPFNILSKVFIFFKVVSIVDTNVAR